MLFKLFDSLSASQTRVMAQRSLNDVSGVIAAMLYKLFDSLSASQTRVMAQRSLNDVSGVIAAMLFIFFDSLSASPNQSNGTTLVKLCVGSNGLMLFKIVATMALRDKMAATVCQWWCGSGDE